MKTGDAPGDKARNNSQSRKWAQGAGDGLRAADATNRRRLNGTTLGSTKQPIYKGERRKSRDGSKVASVPPRGHAREQGK